MMLVLADSEIVGWAALILSSAIAVWEFHKWRNEKPGLHLIASARTGAFIAGNDPKDGTWVIVNVANAGNKTTIVNNVCLTYYSNWLRRLFRRGTYHWVKSPGIVHQIPCKLEPSHEWVGRINQDAAMDDMLDKGYLYCHIYHMVSVKPKTIRIKRLSGQKRLTQTHG